MLALSLACQPDAPPQPAYTPRVREITITTVPLLSKELTSTYPFLKEDFAPTGMMPGKEVFVLPDLVVPLPGQAVTHATYVARHRGIFTFRCSVAAHLPSMWGQLVVLSPDAVGAPPQ